MAMLVVYAATFVCVDLVGRLALRPLARRVLGGGHQKVDKWCQTAMELATYAAFSWLTLGTLAAEPWALDPGAWFDASPIGARHAVAYILYAARYAAATLLLRRRRRDFWPMLAHHALTVALVLSSAGARHARFGLVVMALFEPSDVLLHAAKLALYAAKARKDRALAAVADALFVAFMMSFFALRLGVLPLACLEARRQLRDDDTLTVAWTVLGGILLLNLYWAALILKVLWGLVRTGHAEDELSDDEP
jgi:hypothetical protein